MVKTILSVSALAFFLCVAPSPCFAVWDVVTVSKEEAKALGLLVRTKPAGPNHVGVELEFKIEGAFKAFSPEGKFRDRSGVWLWIGHGENSLLSAELKEDRSQVGSVVVSFTAERAQLDQSNLRVMAPYTDGGLGGAQYRLRVKDFAE
jgi:hypothetical protein